MQGRDAGAGDRGERRGASGRGRRRGSLETTGTEGRDTKVQMKGHGAYLAAMVRAAAWSRGPRAKAWIPGSMSTAGRGTKADEG